jgi:hypothetical protein
VPALERNILSDSAAVNHSISTQAVRDDRVHCDKNPLSLCPALILNKESQNGAVVDYEPAEEVAVKRSSSTDPYPVTL